MFGLRTGIIVLDEGQMMPPREDDGPGRACWPRCKSGNALELLSEDKVEEHRLQCARRNRRGHVLLKLGGRELFPMQREVEE